MNIIVLAGGLSTERDVSISTGTQVCEALRQRGHQAAMLDVFLGYKGEISENFFVRNDAFRDSIGEIKKEDPDLKELKKMRGEAADGFFGPGVIALCRMADIVYMALHGAEGENGKVQAAFDLLGIHYTGSGYLGSAVAMDKGLSKKIFMVEGIPTPKGYTVTKNEAYTVPETMRYPLVVKPCCGGSSVGVSIVDNESEYHTALEAAFRYEDEVVVEECIKGREFSVGVLGGESLPVIEIIPKTGFYDYETKYQPGMAQDVCPAELSEDKSSQMRDYAVKVFDALKLETYGRIDFLMDEKGELYCLEANTLPGMTPTSLLPQEAAADGMDYGALCEEIISLALEKND
ncbi:MAG: D-alanine--D-alanine ligase [Lachnospiraceae bacterium]|nr:D-alanine--D-alanine ligase [Lachnospiraceae bacterium]